MPNRFVSCGHQPCTFLDTSDPVFRCAGFLIAVTGKTCLPESQQILPICSLHCRFSFSGSMMKRMSFSETIFLFFLALIIFGPKKLPEIARQVGKYMNEFKRASNEFKAQIEQEIAHLEVENKQTILPPSAPPEGATNRTLPALTSELSAANSPATDAAVTGVANSGHFGRRAALCIWPRHGRY